MKLAYIILAHTAPNHLLRLVEKLNHKEDTFYIHIDLKQNIDDFKSLFKSSSANVIFIQNRVKSNWGDFSLIQATVNLMREVIDSKTTYNHIVLLSGADYPIKTTCEIRSFYKENQKKVFITYEELPIASLNYGGRDRTDCYSFNLRNRRETFIPFSWKPKLSFKGWLLNTLLGGIVLFKKKRVLPYSWDSYYGSQWWSMSYDALKFIDEFLQENKLYIDYHKHTLIPDELFFQTILLNAYPEQYIVNENMRYIDFPNNSSHPKVIQVEDLEKVLSSGKLFARKFEPRSKVLDLLDNDI